MWHEARKQEKKIRGIMIDHKRRAERRREFYESIRLDPAFYLQIHGQQMKIHIDAAISQAADSSLMPWMGDETNLIDRFDVRAHLDYIPTSSDVHPNNHHSEEGLLTEDQECQLNYERYRPLVQNDFQDNDEQTVLQRIYLKERCVDQNNPKSKNEVKKKLAEKKAAIGYNYEDSASKHNRSDEESDSSDGDDEEEFVDLDTTVNAESLDPDKLHRLNTIAKKFGIKKGLFTKFLESDKFESDKMKIAKEIESEKSLFAGRKSRRERRELFHQRMLILRSMNTDGTSLDHFGGEAGVAKPKEMKESDSSEDDDEASNGPVEEGKIEFITSFGGDSGEDDEEKEARRRLKKLEKKRQEEKKKEVKKKIKQLKNDEGASTSAAVIYGPTLPSTADKQALGGKDIHFVGSNSQRKRHYRYQNSDREDNSPARRIRRSPSVRRDRRSSEDSDYAERRKRRRSRSRSRSRRRSPVYRPRSGRRSRSRSRNRRRIRRRSSSSGSRSRSRSRSRRRSRRSRSVDRRRRSRSRSYRRSSYRDRRRRSRSRSHNRRSKRDSSNEDSSRKRFQSRNSNKSSSPTRSKLLNRNLELKKELEPLVSVSNEESSKAESKVDDSVMPPLPPTPDVSITIAPASPIQDNSVATIPEVEVEVTPPPLPIEALVPPPPPPPEVELPPPPVKRYYRHDLASDSEELSDDEPSTPRKSIDSGEPRLTGLSNTGVSSAGATSTQTKPMLPASNSKGVTPITPQERIRRLMQAQLDKQFKLDKKAEEDKLEKKRLEQIERDKLASKIESKRRRGRSRSASSSDSLHSKSRSSSRSPPRGKRSRRSRSRSRGRRFRRSRSNSRRHSRRRRDRSSS